MLAAVAPSEAWAGPPPNYDPDPFKDGDFGSAPLILDVANPSLGRGELGVMFVTTAIDKYASHVGGALEFTYNVLDTVGLGLSLGFAHGTLTNIVTSTEGIIGNKLKACLENSKNCDITPAVPEYKQITGFVDALATWAPLYGKVNIVSEVDLNLQLYGVLGLGVNGTREVQAEALPGAATAADYALIGSGFGEGGFLNDAKFHVTGGVGVRVFLADWLDLRAEYRVMSWQDEFDFKFSEAQSYWTSYHLTQVGLGFIVL